MATIAFEGYMGAGPGWADLGANTLIFSGSLTDLAAAITVDAYQDGNHAGNGDPGTDQCGANHMNNVKFLTSGSMSVGGGAPEAISDANLAEAECSLRVHFNHTSSVAVTGAKFYCFDGAVVLNEGVGVDVTIERTTVLEVDITRQIEVDAEITRDVTIDVDIVRSIEMEVEL